MAGPPAATAPAALHGATAHEQGMSAAAHLVAANSHQSRRRHHGRPRRQRAPFGGGTHDAVPAAFRCSGALGPKAPPRHGASSRRPATSRRAADKVGGARRTMTLGTRRRRSATAPAVDSRPTAGTQEPAHKGGARRPPRWRPSAQWALHAGAQAAAALAPGAVAAAAGPRGGAPKRRRRFPGGRRVRILLAVPCPPSTRAKWAGSRQATAGTRAEPTGRPRRAEPSRIAPDRADSLFYPHNLTKRPPNFDIFTYFWYIQCYTFIFEAPKLFCLALHITLQYIAFIIDDINACFKL